MKITQALIDRVRSAIPSGGAPLRKISEASGVHISNVRSVFKLLVDGSEAFSMRAGTGEGSKHEVWMFRTEEERERFEEKWLDEVSRRHKARMDAKTAERRQKRHAEGRRSARAVAAERREARKRSERERQEVQKSIDAEKLKATQAKLKKQTAAAGRTKFKAGTLSPRPAKSAWADLPEPDLAHIPVKVIECKVATRHEPRPEEVPPLFSSLRPGQYIAPAPAWLAGIAA